MVHNSVFYDSVKTTCLGKFLLFNYGRKCSQPTRLQYSLIINISGQESIDTLDFLQGDNHEEKVGSEIITFVGCDQWSLLSNQIAGFSDHRYLWKESSYYIKFFCMELVIKQRQHMSISLLVGCGLLCHLSNQIAVFFYHQYP